MGSPSTKPYWIYGLHATRTALSNPDRLCHQGLATQDLHRELNALARKKSCELQIASKKEIAQVLGTDVVHQGCAVKVSPLQEVYLEDILETEKSKQTIMVLDQVTDPHNVGAVLRSCAAFNADALVVQNRHAPPEESGILCKTACGAAEHVPIIRVANLVRALEEMKSSEVWISGLDEQGDKPLQDLEGQGRNALVLGAEGKGLRRLSWETCDFLVRLPTNPHFPTLNVSNAAAVALYQLACCERKSN